MLEGSGELSEVTPVLSCCQRIDYLLGMAENIGGRPECTVEAVSIPDGDSHVLPHAIASSASETA